MRRFILICHVIILAIMPFRTAHAELRLETWQSYGAMAEQGGVCAAFARLMELQAMFTRNLASCGLSGKNLPVR